tara:strand:- start:254 stop:1012 length:759 start_codon:yes stop_codon:yes gene_type:complete
MFINVAKNCCFIEETICFLNFNQLRRVEVSERLLVICIFICSGFAILPFLNLPTLETNTTFIASYGSYLSGTVAPMIALFAFWAVLKTINYQQEQIAQLSIDSQKQEIIRCLEKLEVQIKECLTNHNVPVRLEDEDEAEVSEYTLYQLMTMLFFSTMYTQRIKKPSYYKEKSRGKTDYMIFESVCMTTLYISRMADYIAAYRKLSDDKFVTGFYYDKYRELAKRLHNLEYLNSDKYEFWREKPETKPQLDLK